MVQSGLDRFRPWCFEGRQGTREVESEAVSASAAAPAAGGRMKCDLHPASGGRFDSKADLVTRLPTTKEPGMAGLGDDMGSI